MSSLEALCQQCALCCDGTLFARVAVSPVEAQALRAVAVPLAKGATGAPMLTQPCAALEGTRCRCYAQRPETCRRYVCLLGQALKDGEVNLAGAVEQVEEAVRRREKLGALLGERETASEPLMSRARTKARDDATVRAALDSLEGHLRHYFLGAAGALAERER